MLLGKVCKSSPFWGLWRAWRSQVCCYCCCQDGGECRGSSNSWERCPSCWFTAHCPPVFSLCSKKCPSDQGLQGWTVRSWPFPFTSDAHCLCWAWRWPQTQQSANSWLLYQQHTPASAGATLSNFFFPLLPLSALIILMFPNIMAKVTSQTRVSVFPI